MRPEDFLQSSPLHEAILEGDLAKITALLDQGADLNARDWHDETPLMTALMTEIRAMLPNLKALATHLVESPPDLSQMPQINFKEILDRTSELIRHRPKVEDKPPVAEDTTILRLLLERGADVHAADKEGETALRKAAGMGRPEAMRLLLAAGAVVDAIARDGATPLMEAASARQLETFRLLLERGADWTYRTPRGGAVLMRAAYGGRPEIARLLIERGADVNAVAEDGATALAYAAMRGHTEARELLQEAGAEVGFLEAVAMDDLARAQSLPSPGVGARSELWGRSHLLWAVNTSRVDAVRLLLERGANPNVTGRHGQIPLSLAVMRGNQEILRLLLAAGATTGLTNGMGMSPMHWAITRDDAKLVRLLIERGADVNETGEDGLSLLNVAVMQSRLEIARLLLEAGANANGSERGVMSPLMFATGRGDKAMVELLIAHGAETNRGAIPVSVMAQDKPEIAELLKTTQTNALLEAAKAGDEAAVTAQLDRGKDVDTRGEQDETPLIWAAGEGKTKIARTLLDRGAAINAVNHVGQTALIRAIMRGHVDVARLLIERGADIALTNIFGQTALTCAALGGHEEIVALLREAGANLGPLEAALLGDLATLRLMLDWGADVNAPHAGGMTALMGAAVQGRRDCVEALLIRGADLDPTDDHGQTALAYAACGHEEVVRLLLERGAEVDRVGEDRIGKRIAENVRQRMQRKAGENALMDRLDRKPRLGRTPFACAVSADSIKIAGLLLDHGAKINVSESGIPGVTPLMICAMIGKLEMTRFLIERGADVLAKDDTGGTALQWARSPSKNPEVTELLAQAENAAKGAT